MTMPAEGLHPGPIAPRGFWGDTLAMLGVGYFLAYMPVRVPAEGIHGRSASGCSEGLRLLSAARLGAGDVRVHLPRRDAVRVVAARRAPDGGGRLDPGAAPAGDPGRPRHRGDHRHHVAGLQRSGCVDRADDGADAGRRADDWAPHRHRASAARALARAARVDPDGDRRRHRAVRPAGHGARRRSRVRDRGLSDWLCRPLSSDPTAVEDP